MSPRTEDHVDAENWNIPAYNPVSEFVLNPDSQLAIFFNSSLLTLYCALYLLKSVSRSVAVPIVGAGDGVGVAVGMTVGVGVSVGGTGVAVGCVGCASFDSEAIFVCCLVIGVGVGVDTTGVCLLVVVSGALYIVGVGIISGCVICEGDCCAETCAMAMTLKMMVKKQNDIKDSRRYPTNFLGIFLS